MKQFARWGVIGVAAVLLAGCTAGTPATIMPSPTPELQQALAPESDAPVDGAEQTAPSPTEPPAPTEEPPTPEPTAADPALNEPAIEAGSSAGLAVDAAAAAAPAGETADAGAAAPEGEPANTGAVAPEGEAANVAVVNDAGVDATDETAEAAVAATDAENAANQELAYRSQAEGRPAPPPPPADGSLLTMSRGPSERLEVALTFDAGADTGYAADILDLLRDYGIKATFGMTGVWAEQNPDLVRRIANEGHQLINHTYDHQSFTGASTGADPQTYESMLWQLNTTEQLVWDIAGYEMKPYVRPPYGDIGPMTSGFLVDAGYYINVMWTCDSYGWKGWDGAQIVQHCTTDIGPGEIILLHVGASAPGDFESLPGMIDVFRQAGYSFVTIEQMLQP